MYRANSVGINILWALAKATESKWHLSGLVKVQGWAGLCGFQEQHPLSKSPEAGESAVYITFLLLL